MKLIVGLGNPGKEYNNTRHNIGFMFIDYFAKKNNVTIAKKKYNGKYAEILINNEKIILLKPESYMNLSGIVIRKYIDFFKISIENIIIIHDDLDLPIGKIKLRPEGSSAGHNGLKSIESNLNTQAYKRLKIGISNDKEIETKEYVLGKFSKSDKNILEDMNEIVYNVIHDFLEVDFESLMAKYNRK